VHRYVRLRLQTRVLGRLFHWILLTVSLLAVLGAVAGSHGFLI
jgi:hypothetical protein